MKYYFFINPVAGTGKEADSLKSRINNTMKKRGLEYEIIVSQGHEDLIGKSREIAEALNGSEAWFFAAGGDGTLHEIVNGVYGFDNITVGAIPLGTGNDTVRNFSDKYAFLDINSQIDGRIVNLDLIEYKGEVDGKDTTEYCVNMINIGFDCNVVELTGRLKQKPLISGSFAYLLSVFVKFIKRDGTSLLITEYTGDSVFSREIIKEGELLLCAVCNGSYCGGGIKSAPMAIMDDGVFELNIINQVSRTKFLKLFPSFKRGEHMSIPGIDETIMVKSIKEAKIEPDENFEIFICVDGEMKATTGIKVKIIEKALKFIIPDKKSIQETKMESIMEKPKYNI